MKVQDVTPEYLKKMHEQGIDLGANDVISMRVQDVTSEYVRDIKALGLKPSANELISMKVQDVTPEYVKALQSAGFNPSINDIISAKVQDVTPDFVERARRTWLQGPEPAKTDPATAIRDTGFEGGYLAILPAFGVCLSLTRPKRPFPHDLCQEI